MNFESFNLEDLKNQLFSIDNKELLHIITTGISNGVESKVKYDDAKCLDELKRIDNSSLELDQWVVKSKARFFFCDKFLLLFSLIFFIIAFNVDISA